MPSEEFSDRVSGSDNCLSLDSIREQVSRLGIDRLSDIIWVRAQYDNILREILISTISLKQVNGDLEKAKKIVDKAIGFPERYIRYTSQGHGQILDEIKLELEILMLNGQKEFALQAAEYTVTRSENIYEIFEDGWEWEESVRSFSQWVQEKKAEKI